MIPVRVYFTVGLFVVNGNDVRHELTPASPSGYPSTWKLRDASVGRDTYSSVGRLDIYLYISSVIFFAVGI